MNNGLNGKQQKWHPNGQLWVETYYKDSLFHGSHKEWHMAN